MAEQIKARVEEIDLRRGRVTLAINTTAEGMRRIATLLLLDPDLDVTLVVSSPDGSVDK